MNLSEKKIITYLEKAFFTLTILFNTLIFAQDPKSFSLNEKEYYELLYYAPKGLQFNQENPSISKTLQDELNTIGSLLVYFDFKDAFISEEPTVDWLEKRIDQLATALFIDGKRILIKLVGGYAGCPEKMIEIENEDGIEISIVKFCYTCTENTENGERFKTIFNNRMKRLMANL